jgi:tight adherence protein B
MLDKIVFAVFAAIFLSTLAVYLILKDKVGLRNRRIRKRLDALAVDTEKEEELPYTILRDYKLSEIPPMNRFLSRFRLFQNLQLLIDQAGIPMKAGALVLAMLSLGGLVFLVTNYILPGLILPLAMGIISGSLPYHYVRRKRRKRKEEFESFLPEAIDMMTNALRSGFSLESALNMVAREVPDPVGIEFGIAFEEQNLGASLTDALSNMGKRVQSDELYLMITALLIHKKTGGNLAEILERIGNTIRERFRLEREVKIHTAYGRMSGFILVILPIILAIAILIMNPDYMKVLWMEKIGRYLLGIAIIMQIVGIWVINRIVNIRI